ncbi:MAG: hypothetical protein V1900_01125 [Candidatus Aenigmatarchaeota archaeon]
MTGTKSLDEAIGYAKFDMLRFEYFNSVKGSVIYRITNSKSNLSWMLEIPTQLYEELGKPMRTDGEKLRKKFETLAKNP